MIIIKAVMMMAMMMMAMMMMMMMKCQFHWWMKLQYLEETTDLRQTAISGNRGSLEIRLFVLQTPEALVAAVDWQGAVAVGTAWCRGAGRGVKRDRAHPAEAGQACCRGRSCWRPYRPGTHLLHRGRQRCGAVSIWSSGHLDGGAEGAPNNTEAAQGNFTWGGGGGVAQMY